ncbi:MULTISPECIES: hypothetical protein [unclassified Leeuwenhoekiella]|uniref:hypothetical protein n=1 Tax=unclassified Leeuwenhoekiella TaxID=2615029 RepID=UPI000C54948E|nr:MULTISPECIES: hypothetical protein [unclassified Leeuwenhoekiella]MAW93908.1 hypothetical protein [Leeuwenhoekiella sp.]MBA81678.1 hypothetical protein [Leeuwenhoekiella sp.]
MKHLKALFNFYINSSLHVALAVLCLVWITEIQLALAPQPLLYGFVFFGSVTGYNFVKYAALTGLHHRQLTQSLRTIQNLSLLCFFAFCYFAFQFDWVFWLYCLPLGLLTLLYAIPLFPQRKNLRHIPSLKVFIIAVVWAGVTAYLPALCAVRFDMATVLVILQRVLLILALMIPFEIRDLKYDALTLNTLPQVLGIKKTKLLGLALLMGFVVLELFLPENENGAILISCFLALITAFSILKASTRQSKYYASFFVEGIPVLWWLLLLTFSQLAL